MKETKHTPGPWQIDPDSDLLISNADLYSVGDTIARAATKADARLIAAAPDLLGALMMVLDDPQALDGRPRTAEVVRSAIAKATGGNE